MSKRMFCEHCSPWAAECVVCDGYAGRGQVELEAMRWADDGGRVIDHDADTVPADTLPEVSALTLAEVRVMEAEPVGRIVWAVLAVGGLMWVGAAVYAVGRTSRWW